MRKVLFILGQLSDNDVDWLARTGQKAHISAGTVLIQQGQPIENLYIVLEGLLSVTDVELGGKELAQLGAGEVVGEISLVDSRPPSSTVTAAQDSILLSIPKPRLLTKLEEDVGFAASFYRAIAIFLAHRLRGTVTRLGYGGEQPLNPEVVYQDELDENALDAVYLAGTRFERMLKQLMQTT
ncbi:MAG: cyclic nucleotide-binding domain-containing protein [Anaerolineae bacterium]|nr:cyclic nucleotide-binding domain-containing protein [Anaerolineae bacterium]